MDFGRWRGDDAGVVVDATVRDHDDAWATTTLDSPWGEFVLRRNDAPRGARVRLQVLASDVSLGLSPQTDSSIANEFAVRISAVEEVAPGEMLVRMTPRGGGNAVLLAKVMRRSAERLALAPGRDAYARVKAAAVLG
jgi:molybdate transport system ATP-binding protein